MQNLAEHMGELAIQRGVELLDSRPRQAYLSSGIPKLDRFLGGGIPKGTVSEWGMPPGCDGRRVILAFLARWCRDHEGYLPPLLWVSGFDDVEVYPPAWEAQGVDLACLYFAVSEKPVEALRPVFLEPLFSIIVLDSPKVLRPDALAFLSAQARLHGLTVFLLRPFFLSPKTGNIWAKSRFNCSFESRLNQHVVHVVRGRFHGRLVLTLEGT